MWWLAYYASDGFRRHPHDVSDELPPDAVLARARVTDRIPAGTVWRRDGWAGLNTLTSGDAVLPDEAVDAFRFSAGQASFEARVEITAAPLL